jgi:U3 small nucleolar ribonucleoprotein protein IMP3
MLITRTMEDHITWSDGSKIKAKVLTYNNERDDYDLL